ncbi:thioesterase family protein [Parahaliea aestuarii]|uniref:Thioesterase n=1 Tax=Parahaliea aestuarii TaxID=1852021 RepID=A0A5C9A3B7_9GAMM|nr:thioesterase family protein [Parahaliea aestuarii]TXS94494.1 thioesterase [Parahaliea aestuarii]
MDISNAFPAYRSPVREEWIDYNGHMSEAYYVLVFGFATDALMDAIGVDETCRARHDCSLYTLEAHVRYLREVAEGVPLQVHSCVVDSDHKRLHVYHAMQREDTGELLATSELMLMFVDTASGRSADFPAAIGAEIARFKTRWQARPEEGELGRRIAIPRR